MEVMVDADKCIACQSCVELCPEVFECPEDVAIVKANPVPPDSEGCTREAVEICPTEAIIITSK